jgi:hypothetical protein
LKDSSFLEEEEWRLVSLASSFEEASPRFRPGRSMLVPYYEHVFPGQNGPVPIEELIVGPTPHPELARRAAEGVLSANGLGSAKVRSSTVPYRTW